MSENDEMSVCEREENSVSFDFFFTCFHASLQPLSQANLCLEGKRKADTLENCFYASVGFGDL